MDYKAVNLKLPADLKYKVKVCAAVEGVTMQAYIRNAIEVAVQVNTSAYKDKPDD